MEDESCRLPPGVPEVAGEDRSWSDELGTRPQDLMSSEINPFVNNYGWIIQLMLIIPLRNWNPDFLTVYTFLFPSPPLCQLCASLLGLSVSQTPLSPSLVPLGVSLPISRLWFIFRRRSFPSSLPGDIIMFGEWYHHVDPTRATSHSRQSSLGRETSAPSFCRVGWLGTEGFLGWDAGPLPPPTESRWMGPTKKRKKSDSAFHSEIVHLIYCLDCKF